MDVRDQEWKSGRIYDENVWGKAAHGVAAEGISPEQAVDEAIARIKQILAE
jgi:multiple sugar transport system substrate-binding protein